jgi:hypothetical protein
MAAPVPSLADYVRRIEKRPPNQKVSYFYRGHGATGHLLQPSLFRTSVNRKHEKDLLRELISIHPSEFSSDEGVFEKLVRMQHYSLPTRLLDVTTNPLVALFFACASGPADADGEVLRFKVSKHKLKYYDSDTVSCVANLANLSGRERDELRGCRTDADVVASKAGKRLLQFIKSEKPYFLPEIVRDHLNGPVPVLPRLTNRRLLAQQGAFLVFGLKVSLRDDNDRGLTIDRTPVPADRKVELLRSLDKIGINSSTMFPEVETAAKYLTSKVLPEVEEEVGV